MFGSATFLPAIGIVTMATAAEPGRADFPDCF
jgi:hypothetical protein